MPEVESKEKKTEQTLPEKSTKDRNREQNIYLAKIGVMIFATVVCCILFFFIVYRYKGFARIWKYVMKAAEPIIIGLVLAYLLNPVMQSAERLVYKLCTRFVKSDGKAKRIARAVGIGVSILFLIAVIALLIAAIVPSVSASIMGLVDTVPGYVNNFIAMVDQSVLGNFEFTEVVGEYLTMVTDYLRTWLQDTMLPQAQTYIAQITTGVFSIVKALLNFLVGIFVMAYVLMIKENLIGQSKKLVFAAFKPKASNMIVEIVHKADEIFGGFIVGKIIDSAIIGVICYFGCLILRIPDAMLVAVIIGVTNIIPVFGPFIGAIPALLLVVIQSPWHALYLLIFIIVLQQVDGNIIGPKILGNSTGLSSFWVMFAILIGGGMFGFLGMLLGVPVFALIYYLVRRMVNYRLKKRSLPTVTDNYVKAKAVDEATHTIIPQEDTKSKKSNKK